MTPAELSDLDATSQADLVRSGGAAPSDLVEAAIRGAEAVNPRLNAIIHERFDRAAAEALASRSSGPLAGVPMVVKDLDGTLAGEPYHAGTRFLRDAGYRADRTSLLIQRYLDAGAIVIGKTATPELGLLPSTEPVSTGPTRNPWDEKRSPSGSSGGSASSVAAGVVAVGHAGDGGGSIRLPASVCGLVGLKPSRGLVSNYPDNDPWGGLVSRLAVTRTVRDTALMLEVACEPDLFDAPILGGPAGVVASLDRPPAAQRIGLVVDCGDESVDPECVDAVRATGLALAAAGHHVEERTLASILDPEHDPIGPFLTAFAVWTRAVLLDLARVSGAPVTADGVEPHTWSLFEGAAAIDGATFAAAGDQLRVIGRQTRRRWDRGLDVLITPTCPDRPWMLGQFTSTIADPVGVLLRSSRTVAFTAPFNISGQPAISVPARLSEGLPIGIQMVGRWGADAVLLRLAALLEQTQPWRDQRPPIHVSR